MLLYDVAIIGAGPAGLMAAIRAGQLKKKVVLIERNNAPGKKLLLTGKGRCNVTNTADLEAFIEKFGKQGMFLRPAFTKFFNKDLIEFFKSSGLKMKVERQERVFPETDQAYSLLEILKRNLAARNVNVLYSRRLVRIKKEGDYFGLILEDNPRLQAKKIILATGGASYKATGSSGDGFRIARDLGHTVVALMPALVPLKVKEIWVRQLSGLTLKNIRITFITGGKRLISEVGELLFTHFGVSGPLVLDLSSQVMGMLSKSREVKLNIDLKPGLDIEQIDNRLIREIKESGNKSLSGLLKNWLPHNLIPVFINLTGVSPGKKVNQLKFSERSSIINLFKTFPLSIIGSLPIEEAMVTSGGISTKEIDPRTMESRVVPGLYFAGEIIDICASSGGYNLQAAFSTGYLAGEMSARS